MLCARLEVCRVQLQLKRTKAVSQKLVCWGSCAAVHPMSEEGDRSGHGLCLIFLCTLRWLRVRVACGPVGLGVTDAVCAREGA